MGKYEDIANRFWENLTIILDQRGISWTDFAHRIGKPPKNLASLKTQKSLVSIGFADQVAKELNVSLDYFVQDGSLSIENEATIHLDNKYPDINLLTTIIEKKSYSINNIVVRFSSPKKTIYYNSKQMPVRIIEGKNKAELLFELNDCLSIAKDENNEDSLILVSVDRRIPEYKTEKIKSARQAAQIMNSSNYIEALKQVEDKAYPINRYYGAIYTPGITVFMDKDFRFLPTPFLVDLIAIPPVFPNSDTLQSTETEVIKNKIRTFFDIAIIHKKKTLIMPAFGCGSSNNNPELVANIIRAVLFDEKYIFNFDRILFSFMDDEHGRKNHKVFSSIINVYKKTE